MKIMQMYKNTFNINYEPIIGRPTFKKSSRFQQLKPSWDSETIDHYQYHCHSSK